MPTRIVGRKFRIGPGSRRRTRREPAPLVDGDHAAERREERQDEPAGRDERHQQRAEHDDHDQSDRPTTTRGRAAARRPASRRCRCCRWLAGHAERDAPSSGEAARRSGTRCSVETLVGPSAGTTWNAATVRSAEIPIGATATTSSKPASAVATSTWRRGPRPRSATPGRSATTSSGPLAPSPNFSATCRRRGTGSSRRPRCAVGQAEAHRGRGDGDDAEDGDGQHDAGDGAAGGHRLGGRRRAPGRSGRRGG